MRETDFDLELRTAMLDDAGIVADLEAARNPEDPRDPTMLRFWWAARSPDESHLELVAENDGAAMAFAGAGHEPWERCPSVLAGSVRSCTRRSGRRPDSDAWSTR
jgi:hypothetical protein